MRPAHSVRAWLPLMLFFAFGSSVASAQGIERPRVPLRTARDELRILREAYTEAYNKKDTVAVADMYAPDAVVIQGNGNVLIGHAAIQKAIASNAPKWNQLTITSDTLRIVGNTAWDVGTTHMQGAEGGEQVFHYLTVYRRGLKAWRIDRLAVVPEAHPSSAADSGAH